MAHAGSSCGSFGVDTTNTNAGFQCRARDEADVRPPSEARLLLLRGEHAHL